LNLSQTERMFGVMDWERVSSDEIDGGIGQFLGVVSAGMAAVCDWL